MFLPLFKTSNIDLTRQKKLPASGKCCTTAWGLEEKLSLFIQLSTCYYLRQIRSRLRPGSNCSLCISCDTFATFYFPVTSCTDSTRTGFMNEMATNRSGNFNVPVLNRKTRIHICHEKVVYANSMSRLFQLLSTLLYFTLNFLAFPGKYYNYSVCTPCTALSSHSLVDPPLNTAPFAVFRCLSEAHRSSDNKVSAVSMLLHPAVRRHLTHKRVLLTSPHPSTSIYIFIPFSSPPFICPSLRPM